MAMTSVALMRIPTAEISFLRNMFDVVATRGLLYELANSNSGEHISNAEIVVVDAENATAIQLWNALRDERPDVVGILLTRRPPPDDGQLWVQRPLNSLKILTALGKADLKLNPMRTIDKRSAKRNSEMRTLRGSRILVIDDSATVRKQLELALGEQGIHVQCADNGEFGLHLLSTHHFDLIFLDVVLPGADGYQICKTIKKNKLKQRVPVVMLTSKSSPFDRVKGSLAGCDSYLTKPVEPKKLVDTLHKHLARRAASESASDIALASGSL
jgi:twitching motility two-component system response regulator PilG